MTPGRRMSVIRSPGAVRRRVRSWKARGERVVFVPTMGAFHEGHLRLLRRARRLGDRVVVSIFVNPTQFGPGEDYRRYPRNTARDLRLARAEGADLCFTPPVEAMYPPGGGTEIHVTALESLWEGASRPGHFAGVALVVTKLLHITEPDVLILGQKDAQQAVVLQTLIRDLDLPVRVVREPTAREPDGLARSSRNVYLSPDDRRAAPVLWRALLAARAVVASGERSAARVRARLRKTLAAEPRVHLDYAAVVDAVTLREVRTLRGRILIAVAARLGTTRLIDNLEIRVKDPVR